MAVAGVSPPNTPSWVRLAFAFAAVVALALTVLVGARSLTWLQADWHAAAYRDRINMWAAGRTPWTPDDWQRALASIKEAEAVLPGDAGIQDMLGALYGMEAARVWEDQPARMAAYEQAKVHQLNSVRLRPNLPQGWANLALTEYVLGEPIDVIAKAWREARRLGPYEQGTRNTLLNVTLGFWEQAPDDMKDWVYEQRDHSTPAQVKVLQAWADYYHVDIGGSP
jgi:tetratricopeptide (TPR) repeat protein